VARIASGGSTGVGMTNKQSAPGILSSECDWILTQCGPGVWHASRVPDDMMPPGRYTALIDWVEEIEGSAFLGGLKVRWRILGGKFADQFVYQEIYHRHASMKWQEAAKNQILSLCAAVGFTTLLSKSIYLVARRAQITVGMLNREPVVVEVNSLGAVN
jgi:hypothetical protein